MLYRTSCAGSTCFATGRYGVRHTLTGEESTSSNGVTIWSETQSANQGANQNNYLNGVSCVSSTSCMAAGDYIASGVTYTLTESFNGASWSIETSTNPSSVLNILYGVYCSSASSCLATGVETGSSSMHQSLAELWS